MNKTRKFFIAVAVFTFVATVLCGWTALVYYSFPSLFETPWEAAWETAYCTLWSLGLLGAYAVVIFLNHVAQNAPFWLKEYRRKRYDFRYAEARARRTAGRRKYLPFFVLLIAVITLVPTTA